MFLQDIDTATLALERVQNGVTPGGRYGAIHALEYNRTGDGVGYYCLCIG